MPKGKGSVFELRHVIFIDEAHHYLGVKSSPLALLIREGRSKGVAVLLATQSVSDLSGTAGADYRQYLSNSFFFKTNLNSASEIQSYGACPKTTGGAYRRPNRHS